jgi:O-antigen/teichoic acid export membrane protein
VASTSPGGAARAGAWSALDIVARQAVQFIISVVLARLLSPADFGVMALLAFFTGFGTAVIEGGFATALIQRQDTSREQESVLFWMGLAWSIALAALLVVLGPWIADFYDQPVLAPLMWLAGAYVIVVAIGAVPTALMTRAMRFDTMAKVAVLAAFVSGVIAISAALLGAGVWALGYQFLAFVVVHSGMICFLSGWRPVARLRGSRARPLLGFSSRVSSSSLVDHLYLQGFTLLVGKLHGVSALGIYNRAHATQFFASGSLAMIIRRLTLPLFSSRASDPLVLRETMRKTVQLAMLVNLPVMAGLAITSDLVILILFGPKWLAAAPILSVLAIAGIFWPMQMISTQLLLAVNQPDLYWRTELIKKSVGILLILTGSTFGLMGLAWSQVIFSIFAHFFNGYFAGKYADYGALKQIGDVAGVAMTCAFFAAMLLLLRPQLNLSPLLLLVLMTALGAAIFMALGLALRISAFKEARQVLAGAIGRGR